MFRISLALCRLHYGQRLTFNVTCAKTSIFRSFSQWHLLGAVCLERKPVLTQELTSFEKKYLDYIQQLEFEKSHLSNHELRHIEDLKVAERIKNNEADNEVIQNQTAQDFEDICTKELKAFEPASRVTKADRENDKQSLHRKLDQSLLLVVKKKLGKDYQWILPQAIHVEGETLRQTADRALKEICGSTANVQVWGNAPVGYYKYKYPKAARENGVCGAKVFFYKAVLLKKYMHFEFLENNPDCNDYLWLLRSELKDYLKPVYYKSVDAFLISEEAEIEIESNGEKESDEIKNAITN